MSHFPFSVDTIALTDDDDDDDYSTGYATTSSTAFTFAVIIKNMTYFGFSVCRRESSSNASRKRSDYLIQQLSFCAQLNSPKARSVPFDISTCNYFLEL
jgi:hypothetical protein